jgi:uncharacterized protein YidB (DUF937 family)
MGMFDGLLGNVLGGLLSGSGDGGGQQNPLLQTALQVLQQQGGIGGLVDRFRQAGYGAQADSWVSTGENQPITPDALQQVLGSSTVRDIAAQLGMSGDAAAGGLASVLPQLIDKMTPQGAVPDNQSDLVAQALSLLQKTRNG